MKRVFSVLGLYTIWRLWLVVIAFLAIKIIPSISTFTSEFSFGYQIPWWQWVWANFDGMVFLNIAEVGYSAGKVPFFPLYPWLIRAVTLPTDFLYLQSGLIVSTVAFFVALFYCWKILVQEKKQGLWLTLFLLVLCYPTAYHYTAVYNDSLFFALATATLFFTRQRKYWVAGIVGGLATLTRLNGLALFLVIATEYFFSFIPEHQVWSYKLWPKAFLQATRTKNVFSSGILFAIAIPLAFIGYLGFIEQKFGDWYLFFSGVEVWHRNKITFPLQTFWRYVKILFITPRITFVYWVALLEAVFALLYTTVLLFSWKKIHPTFWVLMFFHLLIPTLTGTFQGMPRYGLHLFPLYYCLGLWLDKKKGWQKGLVFAIFLTLQVFYIMFFTRGYFVT